MDATESASEPFAFERLNALGAGSLPEGPFEIELLEVAREDVVAARIRGHVHIDGHEKVVAWFQRVMDVGVRKVLWDVSELRSLNDNGLDVTIKWAHRLQREGGGLVLYAVPTRIQAIVDMLGLGDYLWSARDQEHALRRVDSPDTPKSSAPPAPETSDPSSPGLAAPAFALLAVVCVVVAVAAALGAGGFTAPLVAGACSAFVAVALAR